MNTMICILNGCNWSSPVLLLVGAVLVVLTGFNTWFIVGMEKAKENASNAAGGEAQAKKFSLEYQTFETYRDAMTMTLRLIAIIAMAAILGAVVCSITSQFAPQTDSKQSIKNTSAITSQVPKQP